MIGAGHSFSPLCVTKDILVSLDRMQGLISCDKEALTATVSGGTRLYLLGPLLHAQGMAMENLGDIDQQSIAGAISTGTHGTGIRLGSLSTQVVALKIVNGQGEVVTYTRRDEAFKAAQLALGMLGIITEVTLQCVPRFKLALEVEKGSLDHVIETYSTINEANRNFEFYWFPHTTSVAKKRWNITEEPVAKRGLGHFLHEYVMENYSFKMVCELAWHFPKLSIWAAQLSAKTTSYRRKVDYSHRVLVAPRLVKFNEMEYNVPLDAYADAVKDVVRWINKHSSTIHFPIENRFVKGDDIYLSPAYGRDSAYIACHAYYKKDFTAFFPALEEILLAYGGRPHLGKVHSLGRAQMVARYPKFGAFCKLRDAQDPAKVFMTKYMASLLDEEG